MCLNLYPSITHYFELVYR